MNEKYYYSVIANLGSIGEVTVKGSSSKWRNNLSLSVGLSGCGKLNIFNGGLVSIDKNLVIDNDAMHFNGRFGGIATDVYVPTSAVIGIYARENGQGMVFEPAETTPDDPSDDEPPTVPGRPEGRPSLKVVK